MPSLQVNQRFPIVLAPTGMVPTRQLTPHVPLTPKEIASDVAKCNQIGITSVHLHARNSDGEPTWEKETYAAIVTEIKSVAPDVLINVSTSGRNWSDIERRADCLALDEDLKPDFASLTLSSLNFLSGPSINSPDSIIRLAEVMKTRGIIPELEIFDLGMVNYAHVLMKKGLTSTPPLANLFFGNIAGVQAGASELGLMVDRLPPGTIWSGAGIGRVRDRVHAMALAAGGGVRVGLEDGIYLDEKSQTLATNYQLVEKVHQLAQCLGLESMRPEELKAALAHST